MFLILDFFYYKPVKCHFGSIMDIPNSCDERVGIFTQNPNVMLIWISVLNFSSLFKFKSLKFICVILDSSLLRWKSFFKIWIQFLCWFEYLFLISALYPNYKSFNFIYVNLDPSMTFLTPIKKKLYFLLRILILC